MRQKRLKVKTGEDGLYHCMSRIVGGDYIFGPQEKEFFTRWMWKLADFLKVEILDYVVMSNHYHQLIWVPGVIELTDEDLYNQLKAYYGENSVEVLVYEHARVTGGEWLDILRRNYLKRIGNISDYQKTLKQVFSTWYNHKHKRRGTLWMERFKSVLVEDSLDVRTIMASYIDLNPVRAEMVEDPSNYRHCGYGSAMGGDERCRKGIMRVMGMDSWEKAAKAYRVLLMERGHVYAHGKKGAVSRELLLETLQNNGRLPRSELVRLRVRYFTDGLVLGSEIFVEEMFQQYRSHFGEKRKSGARPLNGIAGCDFHVIRNLRLTPLS